MSSLKTTFAENVRELRRGKGLSREKFAEKTGLSSTFVAHIENGLKSPSFDKLETIATALGVPAFRLFVPKDGFDEKDVDTATASLREIVKQLFFAIQPKKSQEEVAGKDAATNHKDA